MRTALVALLLTAGAAGSSMAFGVADVASPAAQAAAQTDLAKIIETRAPAVVALKFVLSADIGGQSREQESEAFGVVIDKTGLILVSNTLVGGISPAQAAMFGGEMPRINVKDLKVLIGDDTEGVPAKLLVRDSDLDLAWVKLEKPPAADKPLTVVDFSAGAAAKLGDPIVVLDRLGKFHDRAPMAMDTRIGAVVKKPRNLLIPAQRASSLGNVVFNASGAPIGVTILQLAAAEESEGGSGAYRGPMILPASEVVAATERAMKTAESGGGEQANPAPAAPAAPAAPGAAAPAPAPAPTPGGAPKK